MKKLFGYDEIIHHARHALELGLSPLGLVATCSLDDTIPYIPAAEPTVVMEEIADQQHLPLRGWAVPVTGSPTACKAAEMRSEPLEGCSAIVCQASKKASGMTDTSIQDVPSKLT